MITSLLIANRGEIACRVIRTARRLSIRTVGVYSDADAKALHVRMADEAVHIGPSPARESYLVGERIIAAAKDTEAEAIHPGYGFLSENADFAQAVIDAGLIWVGPKPASIRAMGLKDAAKKLMADAGVPVTPGYLGEDQSPERLKVEADAIGYPVLIKAVAGGGGKGMRRVDEGAAFLDALDSCKREAASSFGNEIVLLEKYILSPRHIEVQVFGDAHGNVVHLFERDCSLQRRHQKVIEEAPAPGMDEATREAVCSAAVRAAQAVDYEGAGTIEFIADTSDKADGGSGLRADRIWFMEMNTRLQVEHPVTEEITGQDLVEWQLRVASGEPLPKRQDELSITGHAIEARLYAEDPAKGFLPSVGRLEHFGLTVPHKVAGRVETGVREGDEISPFYDPMIAKLVVRAETRTEAIRGLRATCERVRCWPVKTNAAFLALVLGDEGFEQGHVDTGMLARQMDDFVPDETPSDEVLQAVAMMVVDATLGGSADDIRQTYIGRPPSAWSWLRGFRANAPFVPTKVHLTDGRDRFEVQFDEPSVSTLPWVEKVAQGYLVDQDGLSFVLREARFEPSSVGALSDGALVAPMPGKVTSVEVAAGEQVTKGQRLLTLEAMKMEHAMLAPFDGVVAELNVAAGAQVQVEAVLARVEAGAGGR